MSSRDQRTLLSRQRTGGRNPHNSRLHTPGLLPTKNASTLEQVDQLGVVTTIARVAFTRARSSLDAEEGLPTEARGEDTHRLGRIPECAVSPEARGLPELK